MCKKLLFSTLVVLTFNLVVANAVKADLIGWYKLDDGSGTVALDSSSYGNDGTLQGSPKWVDGWIGGALELNGTSDWVEINGIADDLTENNFSVSAWIKTTMSGDGNVIGANDSGSGHDFIFGVSGSGTLLVEADTVNEYPPVINNDEWHFIGYVRDGTTAYAYTDGELVGTETPSGDPSGQVRWSIGQEWDDNPSDFYQGLVDDVHFFSHSLTETEILSVMTGEPWPQASKPDPADGSYIDDTWVSMNWRPGDLAVSHDVYFGEEFDDVSNGTGETFRGNQTSTSYIVGFPGFPYPDGLATGTTYYWRIDEVNEVNPDSPWKGDVWSFSVPPKTAYQPTPTDGVQLADANNVTLRWTPGFRAKLHTIYFGEDYDEVNNATGGVMAGAASYNPGPLELEKVYYWRVDEFDPPATYKGDVWSFATPGAVGNPQPAYAATDVQMNALLSWMPADSAASHELYFGTNKDAVRNADTGAPEYKGSKALGAESYDPGLLEAGTIYYWRVDEVDGQGNTLTGPVWVFTTGNFLSVDDFEAYTDDDPAGEAIWQTWIDGFGVADNGAQVGYLMPPYAEQTIIHGGLQSMPLMYVNEAGVTNSEATKTLTAPRDWTLAGVAELSLWFRGSAGNAAEPLYVAVSNSAGAPAVVAHDDANAATTRTWTEWRIPLQDFADKGVNIANVNAIGIGLGTKAGTAAAGGSGTMYFDDIRLDRP
jgi:hypothetical protein